MPLSQRKLSSTNYPLPEKNFAEEIVSLVANLDPEKSDDEFDPNESLFFPKTWVTNTKVSLTCTFWELPSWLQDNKDIIRGYRRPTFSYLKCAQSLFYLHNESVNIWSHLIGALLFATYSFATYFYFVNYTNMNQVDLIAFYCFMAGAMICLGLSSAFHTLCCHSEKVCANWNRCDYVGIVALIFGSICPIIYYGFYCHKIWKIVYFSMIFIFGTATISVAVALRFRKPEFRWFRTGLFIALGGSTFFPVLHAIILYGVHLSFDVIALKSLLITGVLYVVGALIYGARIPERLFPGTFDIWGSSHQIFHFFVVTAALNHYYGIIHVMSYWHSENYECKLKIDEMKPTTAGLSGLFIFSN
ncbi:HlyIII-domain-containing protein [Rhizophagus irregularis]|uniref:HlyIII-domain-containing protein n=1 Tax=Rhizophagus irregularis TaxID=588596 RepID=A0A2N1N9F6_9GLOM|nr:HlyIII-domain-containing protein [Rhizophagus irregularis]